MDQIKMKANLMIMTPEQVVKYVDLLEDRVIHLERERNKFQCQAQGLTTLRTVFRNQSRRFSKAQTRMTSMQRELFKLKREQVFKIPLLPVAKKVRLNKRQRAQKKRLTSPLASPQSTASFYSSSPESVESSSTWLGTPLIYNSPHPVFGSDVSTSSPKSQAIDRVCHYQASPRYYDRLYTPGASPNVDLDS